MPITLLTMLSSSCASRYNHPAVDAQSSRLDTVQQAVGAQSQQKYEQLMVLHQQQQLQANAQMELNQKLMAELAYSVTCKTS
ncbi:hypothetical protein B5M09_010986 [Aphanomyces astaci]|uniref:Uncharacterized protein n=1 Tax=Aphanomyces astaci TaxID=112090 RepID=A0A3R7Y6D3_APHAT|nr:hypothetical protein B5M09_010986 [Aphanomyces astaci]